MRLGDRKGAQSWQRAGLNSEGAQLAEPLNLDHGSAAFGRRKHGKLHQSAVPAAIPGRAQHQAITPRREAHALVLRQRVTTMVSKVQGVSSTTPCGASTSLSVSRARALRRVLGSGHAARL